ncbi:MAG: response regulator transcription factor, partial [Anaerolineae bacterium]|jgi:two-component system NarL family response regulator
VVREGVISMLKAAGEIEVVGQAANAAEAIQKAKALEPDVILLDIRLPGVSGWEACRTLTAELPQTGVIMLTSFEDEDYLLKALRAGARGYLLKTASHEELVDAVRSVTRGERLLSPPMVDKLVSRFSKLAREMERLETGMDEDEIQILRLLSRGATNAEIAQETNWSEVSIKRKLQTIFDKLGVEDRTSAAVEAVRRGLI